MRGHFWQYIQNSEGQPIEGVSVNVYEAGGTTPAYVFTSETGGVASNSAPQATTNEDGFFEFWIGDHTETNGYTANTKFKLVWSKTGVITPGSIDNVDIPIEKNKAGVYYELVITSDWTTSGGMEYYDTAHNLDNSYPMVICYDAGSTMSVPITAESMDSDTVRVWKTTAADSHITVIG